MHTPPSQVSLNPNLTYIGTTNLQDLTGKQLFDIIQEMAEIPANDKGDSIDMEQPPQLAYHSTLATLSKAHHYTSPYFSQPIFCHFQSPHPIILCCWSRRLQETTTTPLLCNARGGRLRSTLIHGVPGYSPPPPPSTLSNICQCASE